MPVIPCTKDGVEGFKCGEDGTCFTGPDARANAEGVCSQIEEESAKMSSMTEEWESVVLILGKWTDDRRLVRAEGFTWREEFSVAWKSHQGEDIVGIGTRVELKGNEVWVFGHYADNDLAQEFREAVENNEAGWPSVELGENEEDSEVIITEDEESGSVSAEFVKVKLVGIAIVRSPAQEGTFFQNVSQETSTEERVAATSPILPPAKWFNDPELTELQRFVTVTEQGHIFGHLAGWNECHIGYPNTCLDPVKSNHDYAYFRVGQIQSAEGGMIPTGPIALKGGHAALDADYRAAQAHYDDPRTAIADVAVGEDDFGIWFSGALRPEVSDEDLRMLRASGVSGDWRRIAGALELVGVCSVNTPGYPKVRARVASGEVLALVASGGAPEPSGANLEVRVARLEAAMRSLNPFRLQSLRATIQANGLNTES